MFSRMIDTMSHLRDIDVICDVLCAIFCAAQPSFVGSCIKRGLVAQLFNKIIERMRAIHDPDNLGSQSKPQTMSKAQRKGRKKTKKGKAFQPNPAYVNGSKEDRGKCVLILIHALCIFAAQVCFI